MSALQVETLRERRSIDPVKSSLQVQAFINTAKTFLKDIYEAATIELWTIGS